MPTWAPLRAAVYRNLWLALAASNIGTWMQTVGARWLPRVAHLLPADALPPDEDQLG